MLLGGMVCAVPPPVLQGTELQCPVASLQAQPSTLTLPLAVVNEFWVTVQKTEAAERCKLQGRYVLKASWNKLVLREAPSSLPLYTWPYRLLRRYGRDKVSLLGRKGVGPWGFVLFPPPSPPRKTWEAG